MAAAQQERLDGCSAAHEHCAGALVSVHLVGADGAEMATETAHVELHLARALHGIDMEVCAGFGGDLADRFHGLQDAGLVVGEHYADQAGLWTEGAKNICRVNESAGLRRDKGYIDAAIGHALSRCQNRRMLNGSGDEVVAGTQQAEDGRIVALGAAGVEDYLGGVAVEECGQGLAGTIYGSARLLPLDMDGGGVAKVLGPIRAHGLHHLRQQRRGGVGVSIYSAHGTVLLYILYG